MQIEKVMKPQFVRQLIQDRRKDGYFIDAFNILSDRPDIIAYGLGQGQVNLYRNPDWKVKTIAKYTGPVAMDHGDINGNGLTDMLICYQYGATMVMCDPQGGKIDWLQNPGSIDGEWKRHYIGRSTAMHRLRLGYFTQLKKLEVLALPITNRPNDVHSVISLKLFSQPENLQTVQKWDQHIINMSHFRVIHEVSVGKYNKFFNIDPESNLDSALIASEEGINWIYYSLKMKRWIIMPIGTGETSQAPKTGFKGSGNVATGKIGNDHCAYIATVQPFHGNKVALYYKNRSTNSNGWKWKWERMVLDVYDNPNSLGQGPGHHIICADFDGDGDDEFLVALRGPSPWKGVYYYKILDLDKKIINKWKISEDSAARIAVADFNGDGRLDFATIGYSVAGYYEDQNPSLVLFQNYFAPLSIMNGFKQMQIDRKVKEEIEFSNKIKATWIKGIENISIKKKSIVINFGNQPVIVRAQMEKKILPRQSIIIQNVDIVNINCMLVFELDQCLDPSQASEKWGWKKLSEISPDFPKCIQLYKSQQFDLGEVQFDPSYVVGQSPQQNKNLFKKHLLKVNLWYAPPRTDCQIHNWHVKPFDFLEVHTQIYGLGRMQKFHQKDKNTLYYEKIMSPGLTHEPFAALKDGRFVYPWHQYYSDNGCIWLANEYHVI